MACYRIEDGGVVLSVRLTPKAARDGVDGIRTLDDGSEVASVRVRAPPVDGAANAALVGLLARTFGVPKSAVRLVSGEGARLKRVRIAGDPDNLARVVDAWPRT